MLLTVTGYSDSMSSVLDLALTTLADLTSSPARMSRFDFLKREYLRGLRNTRKEKA